ncbi:GMC family oxidoreductase [Hoeflea prorocentri]|uniref:GMC family oxidoreductase N-terminal domain-containing protein n=1 Tax=Hoeflea prorocentri TaxID=1922333 RepID=A0A9X3UFB1_9HYPH|nr:GMC family oxidoreductase N-terminal domain-containing protein [Hoeflea prorocentri]MCY6379840.1 GMC family oxidoreductase N-terminal domain-containing protein [Hoeflea prorocentri]MDA5397640.1 GMC family oxidoreductase N-terminal domain-containing protein [Hoeflea prorocentri]
MSGNEFDFIIVGAGSAGCVLAERLSRDSRFKVLVIEAGGSDRKLRIRVPIGYGFTFKDPKVNWCYSGEPDPELGGRSGYWPRGKVIGGSSSINAMVYCRGLPHDFDDWAEAGADDWDWQSVRPVFERSETKARRRGNGFDTHGNGPLWVTDETDQAHPVTGRFLTAAKEAGWPTTDDLNGTAPEGLTIFHNTTRAGWRCSAADAFLRPALRRGNIKLVSNAHVDHLIFDGQRVSGVAYRLCGKKRQALARREVLVSAGAVNSPKLLQLSGIGPADVLQSYGIAVRRHLPEVGGGLQDHLAVNYYYEATVPTLNNQLQPWRSRILAALQYALTRRGLLSLGINQCGGFIRSTPDAPQPDMQIYCNPATYSTGSGAAPQIDPEPGFLLSYQPCRPTSRGRIDIASSDPDDAPRIRPNSLTTNEDCAAIMRGARLLQRLIETPTMVKLIKSPRQPDLRNLSDEEALNDFKQRAATVYHPTSTCRMGTNKSNSVLDARLRVHEVEGLRVVDASAFPNLTSGNTNAPTIMLAQKGADMILEDLKAAG